MYDFRFLKLQNKGYLTVYVLLEQIPICSLGCPAGRIAQRSSLRFRYRKCGYGKIPDSQVSQQSLLQHEAQTGLCRSQPQIRYERRTFRSHQPGHTRVERR